MLLLLQKWRIDGIPGPKAHKMNMIRPTSTRCKFTSKKEASFLQKLKLSDSFFKLQLQKSAFPNFNLQILVASKSNINASFTKLFNFKLLNLKTRWRNPKLNNILAYIEKKICFFDFDCFLTKKRYFAS